MRRVCLLVLAVTASLCLPPIASAKHARAKHASSLRVSATRYAHPGGRLTVTVQGRKRAVVTIALSADAELGTGDAVLARRWRLPKHRRHARKRKATRSLAVPATVAAGAYRLLACTQGRHRHCVAARGSVHVAATATTTADLVGQALAAHRIDQGRALVLRVMALFGDRRLPAAYRGEADPSRPDDRALAEAMAYRAHMTALERRQLAPYLRPPTAPGSWLLPHAGGRAAAAAAAGDHAGESPRPCQAQATTRHWGALTGTHVRVWWWRAHPANRAAAAALVKAADSVIWPAYQRIMGVTPLSDAGKHCNGGDGKYDIYLLPDDIVDYGTLRGVTLPYGPRCTASPAFTEINTHKGVDPPTRFELAHELFHGFQFAFPYQGDCAAFKSHVWFDEATAVWASTRVYPHEEGDHGLNQGLLSISSCSPLDHFSYSGWTFPLDVTEQHGNAVIAAIYKAFADADVITGIDAGLPGGFEQAWKTFAFDGWNQEVTDAKFVHWYGLSEHPHTDEVCAIERDAPPDPLTLQGHHGYRYLDSVASDGPLQRRYFQHTFAPDVKQVTIHNHTAGDGVSDVWAFEQLGDGSWRHVDLSGTRDTTYCLSTPGQDVKTLVLGYDNHSTGTTGIVGDTTPLDSIPGPPDEYAKTLTVDVRDSCARHFLVTAVSGSLTYSAHYSANRYDGDPCVVDGTEADQIAYDPSTRTDATDGFYDRGTVYLSIPMRITGTADWHSSPCQVDGGSGSCSKTIDVPHGPFASALGDAGAASEDVQLITLDHQDMICSGAFKDAGLPVEVVPKVLTTAVPTASLSGDGPFPISWSADVETDERTLKEQLDVTVQPVAEDGGPLGDQTIVEGALR